MKITRRLFLKDGGIAVASVGLAPALGPLFLRSAAYASEPQRLSRMTGGTKTLLCIFQRGAVDGLSMVVPHGDPHYYEHRAVGPGGIALANTGIGSVIDLDGTFGLHPSLAPLKPLYDAGHLAPIHACGSPNATRSHFDAQDYMESAAPGDKAARSGWLARAIRSCPEDRAKAKSLFRGVAMTSYVPRSFQGDPDALAIPDLKSFGLAGGNAPRRNVEGMPADDGTTGGSVAAAFQAMYDQGSGDVLHSAGKDTFEALRIVRKLNAQGYTPANGAQYPRTVFGTALMQIAQLIKANVGLEVAFAEAGGKVNGGKVLGQWPGLAPEQLHENRDLEVTTDFRDVFGEVSQRHLGIRDLNAVFPDYPTGPDKFRNILRA